MRPLDRRSFALACALALAAFPAWAADAPVSSAGPRVDPGIGVDARVSPACQAEGSSLSNLAPTTPQLLSRAKPASACYWAFIEDVYPDASREMGTECGYYDGCTRETYGCQSPYRGSWKEIIPCCH